MSRALARLRSYFDDELFIRSSGRLVLTARAEALADPVHEVLKLIEEQILQLKPFNPLTSDRSFRLATADYCEALLLAPLARLSQTCAPHITVRSVPSHPDDVEALISGDIDLLIALRPAPRAGVRSQTLLHEHFVSLIREDHPSRDRVSHDAELWCNLPHVVVAPYGRPGGPIDDALASWGLERKVACYVQSFLAAPVLAAESNAITTLPASIGARLAAQHGMSVVGLPLDVPGFKLVMSWYERWQKEPGHVWLRGQLNEIAAQCAAEAGGSDGREKESGLFETGKRTSHSA